MVSDQEADAGIEQLSAESDRNDQDTVDVSTLRWRLLRDVTVFQFKLALDGFRDLLLSPISIGLAIYGLIANRQRPGKAFYRLMGLGRRSDKMIALFTAEEFRRREDIKDRSVDELIGKVEELVTRQYEKGGITAQAKDAVEGAIDKVQEEIERGRRDWPHKR